MIRETFDVNLLDHEGKVLKTSTFDTTDQCIKWFRAMGIDKQGAIFVRRVLSHTLPSPNDAELLLSFIKPTSISKKEKNTISLKEDYTLTFDDAVKLGAFMWPYGTEEDIKHFLLRQHKEDGSVRGFAVASMVHTFAMWSEG